MAEGSRIFTPYRALGLVSTNIPPVVRYIQRRKENLIVTVVGNTFHTYGAAKLGLLSVGNPHKNPIVAVCGDAFHIYTSSGNTIYAWRRGTELKHTYVGHEANVHLMLPFGPHLIAVDRLNNLRVWDIKAESLYMQMEFQAKSFEISALTHPAAYLNKILLGSKQGKMQLWNLNTCKLIYSFKGWDAGVCILEQAPASDVIGVGLMNGKIILHNIKYDETVMDFHQDWGRVTGIGFRTDGFPVMVTGSEIGHIAIWNLEEKNLISQIRDSHSGPVLGVKCLLNEPLLITSSPDNTLKMWIFDLPDGGARLLKIKDGHSAPPLSARFYGSFGNSILSAGEDSSMRLFSTVTDNVNRSLGRASYNRQISKKKSMNLDRKVMPAITQFTSETAQEKTWDNVAAIHRGKNTVTTWSVGALKMGKHKLLHERFKEKDYSGSVATCLDLTVCGNFVIIGYSSGHIDKYNIQSGIFRGAFGNPLAHDGGGVSGLVTDGLNQCLVSGGEDRELKWWRMKDCCIIQGLTLSESISKMFLHKDSGLLGIALEDWSIHIVDVDTKKVIRKLYGHQNQVTDLTFSPDSKWLISSSLDKTVRTWDIPSGTCVDCFLVPIPCISLTMSPVGDFLATIHTDHLGIYLWSNRACYHHLSLQPLPQIYKAPTLFLPFTCAESSQLVAKEGEEIYETVQEDPVEDDEYKSPQQISEELVTLALLPTSRWLNLLSLDVIKKRNKPVEPPKVPKSAPFFLPTVPGLEFKFAPAKPEDEVHSKVKSVISFEVLTAFGKKLKNGELEEALTMLMSQGPSSVEVEIRGLDPDAGGSEEVMIKFLEMIKLAMEKQCNFEAVQGYLGLFLKLHAEYIVENEDVYQMCEAVASVQGKSWHNLRDTMNQTLCLVSYFKNAALINY